MAQATARHTGMMAAGLILGTFALFMVPLTVREVSTTTMRKEFVRDVFIVETFSDTHHSEPALTGKLQSTGETYTTWRESIVGLDRLHELQSRNPSAGVHAAAGARADVWYLPHRGVWETIDHLVGLRVQSPNEFGTGIAVWVPIVQILLICGAFLLIRRVVRELRTSPSSSRASRAKSSA
jgi:hypothetical protein